MRKLLYVVVISVISFAPLVLGQSKSDIEREGLRGRVKSIRYERIGYSTQNGENIETPPSLLRTTTYNEAGNKLAEVNYKEDGSISHRYAFNYNAEGRLSDYEEYNSIIRNGLIPRRHTYSYDKKGNKVEYTVYESDGTRASRFVYKYDDGGRKIEEAIYYHTGRLGSRTIYVYDVNGNELEQTNYAPDNSIGYKLKSFYDAKNRRAEATQYVGTILKYEFVYTYDEGGRLREQETFEFNPPPPGVLPASHAPVPGKVVYIYHDKDRTKEVVSYNADGSLNSRVVITYDSEGNEVAWERYGANNLLKGKALLNIEYDSQGNWIKKTHMVQPAQTRELIPYHAERRIITYY